MPYDAKCANLPDYKYANGKHDTDKLFYVFFHVRATIFTNIKVNVSLLSRFSEVCKNDKQAMSTSTEYV